MAVTLDTDFVRQQFPAFQEPSLAGQAFFDNAGGSYACQQVIGRLDQYYRQTKLQPYGVHPASRAAGQAMDSAHERLAEYLGVLPQEVHLGPSTSQNTYVLAQAFAKRLQAGDEIIVTNQDHEANSGVWRRLASQGIVIKEWPIDPVTGQLQVAALEPLLSPRTKVVAFTHCSNILGQINPVAEVCAMAHAVGARTVVDGVSYAGHGFVDVPQLGADIYLFSLYKTFGPHQGLMVIRQDTAQFLGNQAHYFNEAFIHKWFVPAGPDHAQVAASAGVVDYFDALYAHHFPAGTPGQKKSHAVSGLLRSAEVGLLQRLLDFCQHDPRVRLLGPANVAERAATVSLIPQNHSVAEVAQRLADKGIICGGSHFYAVRLLQAMGLDPDAGVLRLSFVHYTSEDEMTQLLEALDAVL
ncbi:cysteine desulfurase [Rhodoferax lithotrophicus]|uniref:Cysteine desulfurase n=1 Tax=Rhodoferax lithotrophicus TaxID=2798804 RepID=A0ABM7MMI6_9BURK|nr:aminotransferase class V-fold PLP-dependent enzyme [Rhodoferax sp. MIZ03]BCO27519.1 cysteine desulfurase [Rhodoferax sp. MIZ03]